MSNKININDYPKKENNEPLLNDTLINNLEISQKAKTILIFTVVTTLIVMILISFLIALKLEENSNDSNNSNNSIIPENKPNSIYAIYNQEDGDEVRLFNLKYTDLVDSIKVDGILLN